MTRAPDYAKVHPQGQSGMRPHSEANYHEHLLTRDELMASVMKLMADAGVDAIVHKTVEHQPTLISEGMGPPYYDMRGTTHLNTFLVYVPSISVPAGVHIGGSARRHYLPRPALHRRHDGQAGLRIRAGHRSPSPANPDACRSGRAVAQGR